MKTKTTEQTPLHTPYSLGFQDGYQQGQNYYKRSMEWSYPQANDAYDQGVEDGQKAARAVNSHEELLEALKHASKYLMLQKENSPIAYVVNKAIAKAEGR